MRNSVIKKNRKVYIFKHQQTSSGGGGGGADLENNKQVLITENGTVEITPSTGKDGMKKVTATVNVSGGGSATAYCWSVSDSRTPLETSYVYISVDVAPADEIEAGTTKIIVGSLDSGSVAIFNLLLLSIYTRISDTEFTTSFTEGRDTYTLTYTRDSTKDFTLWQLSE